MISVDLDGPTVAKMQIARETQGSVHLLRLYPVASTAVSVTGDLWSIDGIPREWWPAKPVCSWKQLAKGDTAGSMPLQINGSADLGVVSYHVDGGLSIGASMMYVGDQVRMEGCCVVYEPAHTT